LLSYEVNKSSGYYDSNRNDKEWELQQIELFTCEDQSKQVTIRFLYFSS
jgi:hypothetical protein